MGTTHYGNDFAHFHSVIEEEWEMCEIHFSVANQKVPAVCSEVIQAARFSGGQVLC